MSAAPEPAPDVRVALVDKQLEGEVEEALALVEASLDVDGARSQSRGFDYLRGHLLLETGQHAEAMEAFAATLGSTPDLAPWARLQLARSQAADGDAEVAAGLVATLLGDGPPRALVDDAVALLEETLAAGGDCRLLGGLGRLRVGESERRILELARAHCDVRGGEDRAGLRDEHARPDGVGALHRHAVVVEDRRAGRGVDRHDGRRNLRERRLNGGLTAARRLETCGTGRGAADA
ncbi:MAG: hypothetical protein AAFX50_23715, partial [Acidobacteriota bacterium]